jgi:hypothetical protein
MYQARGDMLQPWLKERARSASMARAAATPALKAAAGSAPVSRAARKPAAKVSPAGRIVGLDRIDGDDVDFALVLERHLLASARLDDDGSADSVVDPVECLLDESGLAPAEDDDVGAPRERFGEIARNCTWVHLDHPGD